MTHQTFNLDIPKMGYFILVRNEGGWFGNAIEKKQLASGFIPEDAKYTHVEVSGGGRHSVRIAPPRSKVIDIVKTYKNRYIKIVKYDNEDYEKKGRYKVAYFSASLCNLSYDFFGVFAFICKWLRHKNRLYFCSEGALWSLKQEYPKAFGKMKPDKCMPAEFLNPKHKMVEVWEGYVKEEK